MKKLLVLSGVVNVVLVGALVWMHTAHEDDVFRLSELVWKADESHLRIHARSLAALESDDAEEIEEFTTALRLIVEAGESGADMRDEWRAASER